MRADLLGGGGRWSAFGGPRGNVQPSLGGRDWRPGRAYASRAPVSFDAALAEGYDVGSDLRAAILKWHTITEDPPPGCTSWVCLWSSSVDHIYLECPGVQRARTRPGLGAGWLEVDGSDVCGWCRRVWKARNDE